MFSVGAPENGFAAPDDSEFRNFAFLFLLNFSRFSDIWCCLFRFISFGSFFGVFFQEENCGAVKYGKVSVTLLKCFLYGENSSPIKFYAVIFSGFIKKFGGN